MTARTAMLAAFVPLALATAIPASAAPKDGYAANLTVFEGNRTSPVHKVTLKGVDADGKEFFSGQENAPRPGGSMGRTGTSIRVATRDEGGKLLLDYDFAYRGSAGDTDVAGAADAVSRKTVVLGDVDQGRWSHEIVASAPDGDSYRMVVDVIDPSVLR